MTENRAQIQIFFLSLIKLWKISSEECQSFSSSTPSRRVAAVTTATAALSWCQAGNNNNSLSQQNRSQYVLEERKRKYDWLS